MSGVTVGDQPGQHGGGLAFQISLPRIGIAVAEALRDARQKKVSAEEMWQAAKVCRMTNIMRPCLDMLGR